MLKLKKTLILPQFVEACIENEISILILRREYESLIVKGRTLCPLSRITRNM